jgi:FPC/CPF motif-containing protein YcgG
MIQEVKADHVPTDIVKEPIKLQTAKTVKELTEYLSKRADDGDVHSMAVLYFDHEGHITFHWSYINSLTRIIGALERLKFDLMNNEDQ